MITFVSFCGRDFSCGKSVRTGNNMTTFDLTSVTNSHHNSTTHLSSAGLSSSSSTINNGSTYNLLENPDDKSRKPNSATAASVGVSALPLGTASTTTSFCGFLSFLCGSMNSWFRHYRIYKTILLILLMLVLLPLFAHRSLLNV